MKTKKIIIDGKELTITYINIICLRLFNVQYKKLPDYLHKAPGTVKTHYTDLYRTLGVHSLQELLNWARPAKIYRRLMRYCTMDLSALRGI